MTSCAVAPTDKKAYGKEIGQILVRDYGKQKYYSPQEVKTAAWKSPYATDYSCWAMSLYTSPADFASYHAAIGETCDYAAMRAQMAGALTDGASDSWFDVDLSWLEWPDIDLLSVFDLFE